MYCIEDAFLYVCELTACGGCLTTQTISNLP